jgi:hypothetical protein
MAKTIPLYKLLTEGSPRKGELVCLFPKSPDYALLKRCQQDRERIERETSDLKKKKEELWASEKNFEKCDELHTQIMEKNEKLNEYRQEIQDQNEKGRNLVYFPPFVARFNKFEKEYSYESGKAVLKKGVKPKYFCVLDYVFLPAQETSLRKILGISSRIIYDESGTPSDEQMFHKYLKGGSSSRKVGESFYIRAPKKDFLAWEEQGPTRGYDGWLVGKEDIIAKFRTQKKLEPHLPLLEKLKEFDLTKNLKMDAEDHSADSEPDRSPIGPGYRVCGRRFDMDGLPADD